MYRPTLAMYRIKQGTREECGVVPGVDPRVAPASTALAPGHDPYLGVGGVSVAPPDHRTAAVALPC